MASPSGLWTSLAATAFAVLVAASPAAASWDNIFGIWLREDGNARVRVAPCGTMICATNVWIRDPVAQKEKAGDRLEFKIRQNANAWSGSAYDPQRDLDFSATLTASGDKMTTKGCKFGVVCRSTSWTRVAAGAQ